MDENLKNRIEEYFNNITPEELLKKAVEEYGFEVIEENKK